MNSKAWLLALVGLPFVPALADGLHPWREVPRPPLATVAPRAGAFAPVPLAHGAAVPAPERYRSGPAMEEKKLFPPGDRAPAHPAGATPAAQVSTLKTKPAGTAEVAPLRASGPPDGIAPSPSSASQAKGSEPAEAGPSKIQIERSRTSPAVDPALAAAYQALQAGALNAAEKHYRSLLARQERNRDALLGLAAIAAKRNQPEVARGYYRRVLELDPRDPMATAGLLALERPAWDPAAVESRLKTLIAGQPEAAVLHFSLGNHYADQSRWGEARQAYFQAFKYDPTNADYAYNLAVSLDHLDAPRLAGQYYRRALALAETRPAAFDRSAVQARLRELGQ